MCLNVLFGRPRVLKPLNLKGGAQLGVFGDEVGYEDCTKSLKVAVWCLVIQLSNQAEPMKQILAEAKTSQ